MFEGFTPAAGEFLLALKFNNERPWFLAHKDEFETLVNQPFKALALATADEMARREPALGLNLHVARIYRDARRLHGGGPYKEHLWFSLKDWDGLLRGPMFAVPDKGEAAAILEKALPDMAQAAGYIARGEDIPGSAPGFADKVKTRLANPLFYAFFVKSKKFYATDACVSCGKCAALCPTNAVTLISGRPRWGEGCVHCM